MSREVCGVCWCPYDEETGKCACEPAPKAAPPQRKPLSETKIEKLLIESAGMTVQFNDVDLHFARAIERAHGIK